MQEMNYGCGSKVHPSKLIDRQTGLYVAVGGGLEALQFANFSRQIDWRLNLIPGSLPVCRNSIWGWL